MAADFENYKKRAAREKEEYVKFANEDLIRAILPFIDNLERAVNHAEKVNGYGGHDRRGPADDSANSSGPQQIRAFFLSNRWESPSTRPCTRRCWSWKPIKHEPNQVVEEFQKGYLLNDRLLRPATVSVSKLPEKEVQAS